MEEVEVKKKEEKKEKKNNYLVLIIIGALISLLLIGGAYYFIFVRDDEDVSSEGSNNIAISYKALDGKEITLKEIENDKDNFGLDPHTFELSTNGTKMKVFNNYITSSKFTVFNDNNWYLLNRVNNKIIAYYESKNKVDYDINGLADDEQEWYIIYDNEKIVRIVNENNGTILSFDNNYPDDYIICKEIVYLKHNNKVTKYDNTGKQLETNEYDKIVYFDNNECEYLVYVNDDYYYISLDNDDKQIKFKKFETYKGDNKKLEIYLLENINFRSLLVYDDKYYFADSRMLKGDEDYEKYEYNNIYFDESLSSGQNYDGSFLVNRKTKELVSLNAYSSNIIYKVSKGYYFVNYHFEEGDPPYEEPQSTKKVTTSTGKTLKGNGMYTVTGDNLTIEDGNNLFKYDINGNVVSNLKCDKIYLIDDGYAFVKIDSKYYVIDIANNFKQKQVEFIEGINPDKSLYIYKVNNEEMLFMKKHNEGYIEYEVVYTYNFNTKKLETTIYD